MDNNSNITPYANYGGGFTIDPCEHGYEYNSYGDCSDCVRECKEKEQLEEERKIYEK